MLIREGRRSEFKAFAAFQDEARRAQIPDPNAPATYEASRPEPSYPAHAQWVAALLALRREHIVPGIPGCRSAGASALAPGAVAASWTLGTGQTLTILLNLGDQTVAAEPSGRATLFSTGGATPAHLPPASLVVQLG